MSKYVYMTDEKKEAKYKAEKLAMALIEDNNFNKEDFDKYYNNGVSADNRYFGQQIGVFCANMMALKSEKEIKEKMPRILKVLSNLNDSEFAFGLECVKNRLDYYNSLYTGQKDLIQYLIKEAAANTELQTHPVIENFTDTSKEKATINISRIRESSEAQNTTTTKLKNT